MKEIWEIGRIKNEPRAYERNFAIDCAFSKNLVHTRCEALVEAEQIPPRPDPSATGLICRV
jgi:hypothetical protein